MLAIAKVFMSGNDLIVMGKVDGVQKYLDDLYESNCLLGDVEINKEEFSHKCEYCESLICESLMADGEMEECPVLVTSHEVNLTEEDCNGILCDYKKDMPWAEIVNIF